MKKNFNFEPDDVGEFAHEVALAAMFLGETDGVNAVVLASIPWKMAGRALPPPSDELFARIDETITAVFADQDDYQVVEVPEEEGVIVIRLERGQKIRSPQSRALFVYGPQTLTFINTGEDPTDMLFGSFSESSES